MGQVTALGATIAAQEDIKPQPTISFFDMWKGILVGSLTSYKIILAQQKRIRQLENALSASDKTIYEMERHIIAHGDTEDSPKTLRHKLLRVVDENYHQKTKFFV